MFHIAAGAALGRTALPQPLHPLTLAVLGDWPEPTHWLSQPPPCRRRHYVRRHRRHLCVCYRTVLLFTR